MSGGDTGELSRLLFAAEHAVDIAADTLVRGRAHVRALIDKGDYGFATVVDVEVVLDPDRRDRELRRRQPAVLDLACARTPWAASAGYRRAPLLGERFVAVEGAGASRNGARIRVAEREVGDPLVALSDFAFGRKHRETNELRFAVVEELVRRSMRLRIHGSVALGLAWLAAGRMSGTAALSNLPWDVSAGVLLVRQAGGLVFDNNGETHGPRSSSTLAAVPAQRETLVSVIAAAMDRVEP